MREKARAQYVANPERARHATKKWLQNNMPRVLARNRDYRRKHPDKFRDHELRSHHALSLSEYEAMLSAHGGVCAICRRPCKSGHRLAVDHSHVAPFHNRGLLCSNCNLSTGKFVDSPALLLALVRYARKWRPKLLEENP